MICDNQKLYCILHIPNLHSELAKRKPIMWVLEEDLTFNILLILALVTLKYAIISNIM